MSQDDGFWLPRFTQRQSGLIAPSSVAGLAPPSGERAEVPDDVRPPVQPVALSSATPDPREQVAAYASEEELGLPTSSADDIGESLAGVGFEPAMVFAALLSARIHAFRRDRDQQLQMARELFDDKLFTAMARFVARHEHGIPFAEQNSFVLQRLLIEAAADAPADRDLTSEEAAAVVRALIASSSVSGMVSEEAMRDATEVIDWLAFLVQNGAYNSTRLPLGEVVRAQELFARLAGRHDLQDPLCPIGQWCAEDYGFSVGEQMTLGFAIAATTGAVAAMTGNWEDDPATLNKVRILPEHFDDVLVKLDWLDRRQQALELLSATRAELQAEFKAAGTDPSHVAWEIRPFMRRPFLRCADGSLILISPRALRSWLGEGFHYRLLDSAQRRSAEDQGRTSNQYSAFAGRLLEAYAVELMESVHPGQRPAGGGRVHGEQRYGRQNERKTSDVAVDLGQDLVLAEVSASRLRADTLIMGDTDRTQGDIDRLVIRKIKQLDGCISALQAGSAEIPEVNIEHVKRIWPVLVTAGDITQSPSLWLYIDQKTTSWLKQPAVQPLTLLDIEDYEQLLGLVERGHSLHSLLARKTGIPYKHVELAVWIDKDPYAPQIERPPRMVDEAYKRETARMEAAMHFGRGIQPVITDSRHQGGEASDASPRNHEARAGD